LGYTSEYLLAKTKNPTSLWGGAGSQLALQAMRLLPLN